MIYLSFVKLYFSSTFNYVQFNHIKLDIKVPVLPLAPHVRLPNRQCHAFLQERIQNAVKRSKKAMCDLERARPKNVRSFFLEKKWRRSPKKKTCWFPKHLKLNELVACVFIGNTLMRQSMSLNEVKRHHTHNSVFYFCFIYLPLLQQVFCNIPANQIIISTYN